MRTSPVNVPLVDVQAISPGGEHSLLLQSDGNCSVVWAWGRNLSGQLGDGSQTFSFETDERVRTYPAPVKGIGELDCAAFAIYVTGNGTVGSDIGSLDCQGALCSELFALNDMPTLTATPDAGNEFVGWGKECGNPDGNLDPNLAIQVMADRHRHCTAEFELGPPQNQPPSAAFTFAPTAPMVNELVSFDASGSTDDGTIVMSEWDFTNDGVVDTTGVMTMYTYTVAGDNTVRLRVTDDGGLTDEATQTVTVEDAGTPTLFSITVVFGGNGMGIVNVNPPDINLPDPTNCTGMTCVIDNLAEGDSYVLTATATGQFDFFFGWDPAECDSGDPNAGTCIIVLNSDRTVNANFGSE